MKFARLLAVWVIAVIPVALGQTAAQTSSTMGAVTKIDVDSKTMMLKTDTGAEVMVTMLPTASYRRVASISRGCDG